MKKKIMHIAQAAGGVDKYIQMLLKNMDKSKYENIIVCSEEFNEENYYGLVNSFEKIEMVRNISFKADIKSIFRIRKIIKKYNPDIVYMHSSKAGAVGRIANIGIKNKSLYNPHGWAFNMKCGKVKKILYKNIEKLLSNLVDIIITISDFEKESALNNNICKKNKIKVIYNGIDCSIYNKETIRINRKNLGIPEDSYIIGMVGRISKQKAPDTFIRVASLINDDIPETYFMIVGDGEERQDIESLIKELGIEDRVLITGWVEDSSRYIDLFDQALLLSRWEGFGLVLAEYMRSGKPIVATNIDAIPNIINSGYNGILIEVDNVKKIADACKKIIVDKELSIMLSNNGKEIVRKKFDILRVVAEHDEIFNKI